ncbi:MAG: AmmeMemoRadiSam system radical SAM enzyme [bacterium]
MDLEKFTREARYYKKLPNQTVQCTLCPKKCKIGDVERGYCGNRENRKGTYYTLVYGNPCAIHIDKIEKKPFFHYLPGNSAFSLSTAGCNFVCKFCQNWQISQSRPEQTNNYDLPPEKLVFIVKQKECKVIAYTYGEPVVFYEYMLDTCKLGRKEGLKNVIISNGYINQEPMEELCHYLDAVKIDLKAITKKFYQEICDGTLEPVLNTLKLLKKLGMWFEVVYLVIPTLNDKKEEFKELGIWIKENLGSFIPLHFSRFYPLYLLTNLPPTPVETLEQARNICLELGLKYVYIGNVPGHPGENTYCHKCNKLLIDRMGYDVLKNEIRAGKCKFCGQEIPGVWTL